MKCFEGRRQRSENYLREEGTWKYKNGAKNGIRTFQDDAVEKFFSGKFAWGSVKLLEVAEYVDGGDYEKVREEMGKLWGPRSLNKTNMDVKEPKSNAEEIFAAFDVWLKQVGQVSALPVPRKTMKSTALPVPRKIIKSTAFPVPRKTIKSTALPVPRKIIKSTALSVPWKTMKSDTKGNRCEEPLDMGIEMDIDALKSIFYQPIIETEDTSSVDKMLPSNQGKAPPQICEDSMEDRFDSSTTVHETAHDYAQLESLKVKSDTESVVSVETESQFARQSRSVNIVPEITEEDNQNGLKEPDLEITPVSVASVVTESQFAPQSRSTDVVPEVTEEDHQNGLKIESGVSLTSMGTESQFAPQSSSANIVLEITEEDHQNGYSHTTKSTRITCRTCSKNIIPASPMKQYSSENIGVMQTSTPHKNKLKDWLKKGMPRARDMDGFLLYCLLYAYDERVSTSKLISYCIQDGLITRDAVDNRRGEEIVELLSNAALLEINDGGILVNIPDTSKDSALEILLSEVDAVDLFLGTDSGTRQKLESDSYPFGQYLTQSGVGSNNPVTEKVWENAKIIFLMNKELPSLPESPYCSKLLMLLLQRNHHLRAIPQSFFSWMRDLRILDVSETNITSLSSSISHLVSLVRLIARNCKRLTRLPPEVGELVRIESIEAGGSNLYELPQQIGVLLSMKCLEVSLFGPVDPREYSMLPEKLISPGIFAKLTSLTTLSICVHPGDRRWIKDINSTIADISLLENLSSLRFHFPEIENLSVFLTKNPSWKGSRTTKFNFVVGHDVKRIIRRVPRYMEQEFNQKHRCLRYVNGEKVPKGVIEVLKSSEAFYLDHHVEIRSLSEFLAKNFNQLKFCIISECPRMETIVDGNKELNFAELELLSINYLPSCMSIWNGSLSNGSFAKLKFLQVQACLKLKNLLTTSMCRYIVNLEKLVVNDCAAMEELISDGNSENLDEALLPNLKILELGDLPKLVRIFQGPWPRVQHLVFYHLPELKNLNFGSNLELIKSVKIIESEPVWWNNLEWDDRYVHRVMKRSFKPLLEDDLWV